MTDSPVDETPGETPPEEAEGAAVSAEQEKRLIDKAVAAAKAVAKEIVETVTGTAPEETPLEETPLEETPEPTTAKGVEDDLEAKVRDAVHKIGAEEQHAADHERIKREAERQPAALGKVTRFLWGGGSDD